MARRKSNKVPPRTASMVKEIAISSDSDEGSSDDETFGDLANLASRVARGIKEKLTPSATRVLNLRNRTVSHTEEEDKLGFVIDKAPSNIESIIGEERPKETSDEAKSVKSRVSDNRKLSVGEDVDSSDDDDDEVANAESEIKQKSEGQKTSFEKLNLSSALQVDMETDLYVDLDEYKSTKKKSRTVLNRAEEEVMKKSVLTPDFEKKHEILPYSESRRQIKKKRQAEKDMTKGKNWFDMKAPEMTEQMKNDLTIIQHRNILDPKHFYKAPDRKVLPKFFQFGKVVDDPVDFYNGRIPKKQRKSTLVDELLADADLRRYNKRKYTEVIMEQTKRTGAYRDIKFAKKLKLKKRKK